MSADVLTYTGHLVPQTCWCGIHFAMPSDLDRWHRQSEDRRTYCPLGHAMVVRTTEATALRAKLDQAETDASWWRKRHDDARADAEQERRTAAAYKGHLTRMRKRIANGVCPVPGCKRSGFDRVMAHIATQHADWLIEHPELVP